MQTLAIVGILVALLLLLGGLLYLAAQFVISKIESKRIRVGERKKKTWVWRSFILMLLVYSIFLLLTNKKMILSYFYGPFQVFLTIFLVVYFVALLEIVVIDMLLPDVVSMWKRIVIEVICFLLLCSLTVVSFNLSLKFIAAV